MVTPLTAAYPLLFSIFRKIPAVPWLPMRPAKKYLIIVPLLVAAFVVSYVTLPLYAIGPGPARDVEPLIHVSGHTEYASTGRFVMTSVSFRQLTAVGAFIAWLDPSKAVVSRSDLFAPGETDQQEQQRAISQMDQSKIDAVYVVLKRLTDYPKEHGSGVLVENVQPGCPAAGRLFPGDLILSIDGTRIRGESDAAAAIGSVPPGNRLTFHIRAAGQTDDVELARKVCAGKKRPLVGVGLVDNFPFPITISSGDVGGPSAGLMWALGLYDLLTPGDLTGGRTIAGTGEIGLDGAVFPIGGIAEKIVAADRAGAAVFLVPQGNYAEAKTAGASGMRLVSVSTFQEALDYLQSP